MSENKVIVTNTQRFSLHDGPGIRTTVFFKGCSLRCPWCCNPENIETHPQNYVHNNKEAVYGTEYSPDELYEEIIKDKAFYTGKLSEYNINCEKDIDKLPGGITFSGGEPLLQLPKISTILEKLKQEHIHMCIETSLYAEHQNIKSAVDYIDFFYVDMKSMNREFCKNVLHGDMDLYVENFKTVLDSNKPVIIRIPVIGGYTNNKEHIDNIVSFLNDMKGNIIEIELLKGHDLGRNKYLSLGHKPPIYKKVDDEQLEIFKNEIKQTGYAAKICKV